MNPRTGRPPKLPEDRRSVRYYVRLTPSEAELVKKAGNAEWARTVLLKAARRTTGP